MSAKLMGQVWELDLPHHQQSVLLALADHARDDGSSAYPSVDYLAWKTGYSARNVPRILSELENIGLISAANSRRGGRGHQTEWQIHIENGTPKPPFNSDKGCQFVHKKKAAILTKDAKPDSKGCQVRQERVTDEAVKDAKSDMAHIRNARVEPSVNHQYEPSGENHTREVAPQHPATGESTPPSQQHFSSYSKSKAGDENPSVETSYRQRGTFSLDDDPIEKQVAYLRHPFVQEIRNICKKTTICLSSNDTQAMKFVVGALVQSGATMEQLHEFERKVVNHWIAFDRRNNLPCPPKIMQVLEYWGEVLALPEPDQINQSPRQEKNARINPDGTVRKSQSEKFDDYITQLEREIAAEKAGQPRDGAGGQSPARQDESRFSDPVLSG